MSVGQAISSQAILGPNMVLADVSDSCCSSNRPGCCDSSVFARQDQLYQQLQELRLQFLADLWDILGKFKVRLDDHVRLRIP
ncbi:hypothetical protein R1sor_025825 [Riccia sorocarpa]|uniref:Uncharacterized protein n=1 Tax=Riccia sorocarpa TaxID=122646 RepID=A0ABD3GCF6_9MARC